MHIAFRLVATSSMLVVLLQTMPATPIAEPSLGQIETPHVFDFRTNTDAALTEWALARFERAGLRLPPLAIAFHDVKQPCDGHFGFYRSGTPAQIDICGFNWNRFLTTPKKTILHELGHAWAGANLTEESREDFIRFRGLDTWGDDQTPWQEQGSEQAAEIIAWALMDKELLLGTIRDADPRSLAQAYELLTSSPSPSRERTPITLSGAVVAEDERLISWAVGRFRDAGLALPEIDVVFDPSGETCEGASGRFMDDEDGMLVALCTSQQGLTLTNRVAILHELAHAWLSRSTPVPVQTNFLDLRGLETWNDPNHPWHERGFEQAAEIIAWALMDQEVWMYRIRPNDSDSLQAGYQLLIQSRWSNASIRLGHQRNRAR
jgi:Zn-dependent peptidase ImmA (M78 family)